MTTEPTRDADPTHADTATDPAAVATDTAADHAAVAADTATDPAADHAAVAADTATDPADTSTAAAADTTVADDPLAALDVRELGGTRVLVVPVDGPTIDGGGSTLDVIGDAFGAGAELVALPVERLGDEFLRLRTGVAGETLQKFVNYHLQVAVVGDVSAAVAASDALRDFVRESDRGRHVWFVADLDALEGRLRG